MGFERMQRVVIFRTWRALSEVLRTELPVLSISLFGKRVRKIEGGSTCAGRESYRVIPPWQAVARNGETNLSSEWKNYGHGTMREKCV